MFIVFSNTDAARICCGLCIILKLWLSLRPNLGNLLRYLPILNYWTFILRNLRANNSIWRRRPYLSWRTLSTNLFWFFKFRLGCRSIIIYNYIGSIFSRLRVMYARSCCRSRLNRSIFTNNYSILIPRSYTLLNRFLNLISRLRLLLTNSLIRRNLKLVLVRFASREEIFHITLFLHLSTRCCIDTALWNSYLIVLL